MKFTWFNLMPWPYLPDDFRQRHGSVWVDIPSTLYDPRKGHHVYHTYAARWQALIPGARVELVESAGHMLPYEQPEAFVRTLAGFLG